MGINSKLLILILALLTVNVLATGFLGKSRAWRRSQWINHRFINRVDYGCRSKYNLLGYQITGVSSLDDDYTITYGGEYDDVNIFNVRAGLNGAFNIVSRAVSGARVVVPTSIARSVAVDGYRYWGRGEYYGDAIINRCDLELRNSYDLAGFNIIGISSYVVTGTYYEFTYADYWANNWVFNLYVNLAGAIQVIGQAAPVAPFYPQDRGVIPVYGRYRSWGRNEYTNDRIIRTLDSRFRLENRLVGYNIRNVYSSVYGDSTNYILTYHGADHNPWTFNCNYGSRGDIFYTHSRETITSRREIYRRH